MAKFENRRSEQVENPGPCRAEFSDVGFDFIVVGTNEIKGLVNSAGLQNLNYLAFAPTGAWKIFEVVVVVLVRSSLLI